MADDDASMQLFGHGVEPLANERPVHKFMSMRDGCVTAFAHGGDYANSSTSTTTSSQPRAVAAQRQALPPSQGADTFLANDCAASLCATHGYGAAAR